MCLLSVLTYYTSKYLINDSHSNAGSYLWFKSYVSSRWSSPLSYKRRDGVTNHIVNVNKKGKEQSNLKKIGTYSYIPTY